MPQPPTLGCLRSRRKLDHPAVLSVSPRLADNNPHTWSMFSLCSEVKIPQTDCSILWDLSMTPSTIFQNYTSSHASWEGGKGFQDIVYFLLKKMPKHMYQKFLRYSWRILDICRIYLIKLWSSPGLNGSVEMIWFIVLFTAIPPYINLSFFSFRFFLSYFRTRLSFAGDGRTQTIW